MPLEQGAGSAARFEHEFPSGHRGQYEEPLVAAYLPSSHGVQEVVPPGEAVPAGHSVGSFTRVYMLTGRFGYRDVARDRVHGGRGLGTRTGLMATTFRHKASVRREGVACREVLGV